MVQIPAGASLGSYSINGVSGWINNLNDLQNRQFSASAVSPTSNIIVAATEGNGPCNWIATPTEGVGDGDGHLEIGEWATYGFSISDQTGIQSFTLIVNGIVCTNYTIITNTSTLVTGIAHAKMTQQANLTNVLEIDSTDNDSVSTIFQRPVYVPAYHYTVWTAGEYNGWTVQAAGFEPTSSLSDGAWTVLSGGNPVAMPALQTNYAGPVINTQGSAIVANLPFAYLFGLNNITGSVTGTLNATLRPQVVFPLATYPIYTEYNSANVATARFNGTPEMCFSQFHVALVNTTGLSRPITLEMIASATEQTTKFTDVNGDFTVTSADLPSLGNLQEGYYALLVLDYRLPGIPCLVSEAPLVVTKCNMTATKQTPGLQMPGQSITYTLDQVGSPTPGAEYMYMMAMVPLANYTGTLNITSNGTLTGTTGVFTGFTVTETVTADPNAKTITIVGINGTYTVNGTNYNSTQFWKNVLISELGASDVSIVNSSVTTLTSGVDLTLSTKSTMPAGKYVVFALAINNKTGAVAAFNQSYVDLGMTYNITLNQGWNLISSPLIPADNNVTHLFAPIVSDVWVSWYFNETQPYGSNWEYYTPLSGYPPNSFNTFNETRGFWVLVYNNTTLSITGTVPLTPNVNVNPNGWTIAGNPTFTPRTPASVYGDAYVVWGFDSTKPYGSNWEYYTPLSGYPANTLTSLLPGLGYWTLYPKPI